LLDYDIQLHSINFVCSINISSQWALDYESLTQKMSANSTGCYSIPSCSSSHQQFSVCTRCPQLERQLEESNSEVHQLAAKLETLQHTIDQRNREIEHLENENHAIQFQVCWSGIAYIPCTELCRLIRGDYSIITCIHSQLAASVNGQPACESSCVHLLINNAVTF